MSHVTPALYATLADIVPDLHVHCLDPWCLIGSAAALLVGADVGVADVDVLVSRDDAARLMAVWAPQRELGFEPIVCGMAPDEMVDQNTGGAFAAFAFDGPKFGLVLRSLEPQGYGDASQHPVFHAGNVCRALHESQTHGSVGRRTVG